MIHLIYSDVHMKPENLKWCSLVFEQIEAIAFKEGVVASGGYLVNGGDLFNERGVIKTSVFDLLAATRRRWAEKQIRHIDNIGNHDQEDRDGSMHPLRVFDTFPGSTVIEEPIFFHDLKWWFFPYSHKLEAQLAIISKGDHSNSVCFAHAGIKTAFRNDKSRDTDGISVDKFKGFKKVYCGHYHYRHEFENVQYIGSVMQHSYAEAGQIKGVLIYDDEKETTKHVPILGTPQHFKLDLEWDDKGHETVIADDANDNITDIDHVEFTVRGSKDRVRSITRDCLGKKTPSKSIKISRKTEDDVISRIGFTEKDHGDIKSLMEKYVGHLDPQLDQKRLIEIGMELMG